MRSKELSVELRDRIGSRHRSGEGYQNIYAALKIPKNTVASIILTWKKFGTTKTLPRVGRPAKLSNRGRRGQGGDQEPDGPTNSAVEFLCGDENLPEGQPSLQHSTNQAFMVEWQDRSHSSVKGTWQLGVCHEPSKDSDHEKQDSLV
uniref:Sleeping Beauty transposase HTH domain-containing protein n=1 Tax=Oncorhynchus tshawytscha TaxID=74940 RepID=A0AAZ3PD23_ONCTS